MAKALLIVEGAKLEPMVFTRLAELYAMDVEIVPFKANIYQLYKRLEEYGFDYDVKQALIEQNHSDEAKAILSQKYAYTYLVFDCDAQDRGVSPNGVEMASIEKAVADNYSIVDKMIRYFIDETDPDRGKLYVNYPMMESYRDADSFDDEAFISRVVPFLELCCYKESVNRRKLSRYHVDKISEEQWDLLIGINLRKLNFIMRGESDMPDVGQYEVICSQVGILDKQKALWGRGAMYVVNTSLFLPVDYLGKLPQVHSAICR